MELGSFLGGYLRPGGVDPDVLRRPLAAIQPPLPFLLLFLLTAQLFLSFLEPVIALGQVRSCQWGVRYTSGPMPVKRTRVAPGVRLSK